MSAPPPSNRLLARVGTVRVRTTVAAVVIVGAALLAGGVALVVAVRHTLTNDARAVATSRAGDVVAALRSGAAPYQLAVGTQDDVLIQILDAREMVVASTPVLSRTGRPGRTVGVPPPMARVRPGQSTEVVLRWTSIPISWWPWPWKLRTAA